MINTGAFFKFKQINRYVGVCIFNGSCNLQLIT
jgi:hypothetical protein